MGLKCCGIFTFPTRYRKNDQNTNPKDKKVLVTYKRQEYISYTQKIRYQLHTKDKKILVTYKHFTITENWLVRLPLFENYEAKFYSYVI